jgi:hypothetical protein
MASTHDSATKKTAHLGMVFLAGGFWVWVGMTALEAFLNLLDVFSLRRPKPSDPDMAGTSGTRLVAGMPLGSTDSAPVSQTLQTESTVPPVASDVFMGKKIEGLRPATLDRARAE